MSNILEINRRSRFYGPEGAILGEFGIDVAIAEIVLVVNNKKIYFFAEWISEELTQVNILGASESIYDLRVKAQEKYEPELLEKAQDIAKKALNSGDVMTLYENVVDELIEMIAKELEPHGWEYALYNRIEIVGGW